MIETQSAILSQYAADAAFLWLLRDAAVRAPHYSLADLNKLDDRIEAHLDGLRVGGDAGWEMARKELAWEEPGEIFTAAVLAFESDDMARIQPILTIARQSPELARGMISALGFLPHQQVTARIAQLTGSQSPDLRFIGVSASAVQRIDPGKMLTESLESDDARLRARARRAAGELGRRDLLPSLRAGLKDDDATARFWAAWSIGLLGDRGVADLLREFVMPDFVRQVTALDLALRLMDVKMANGWRDLLAQNATNIRMATMAVGIIGDPVAIPWLIEQMRDHKLARVAGESFTSITGADLSLLKLESSPPEETEAGPNDNPEDENVAMDADENLPWPGVERIQSWWSANSSRFTPGKRYLLGAPIAPDALQAALREGKQRHRAAAAIELMIADPKGAPSLFEVRAHARTQQRLLGISARLRNL